MERVIIGTAGHVDHGKTVLTKALTGIDTDRLKEERKRGISIELGFAPLTLPSGTQVGLVDVPGHERFIKNMLAGIAGIDLVLLVIAADEGVMPQTREHLDIINLLEVKKGIVVLTKIDLVESDWLELVESEIEEILEGTVLKGAPIAAVSAHTGQGIPQLLGIIDNIALGTPKKMVTGRVRIPIDRVFSMTGFGTVITGTLWSGHLGVGERVEILPRGLQARVRNIQVHGKKVMEATAGQRVAVNLAGLEIEDINRGDVLAVSGFLAPSYRIDVKLHLLAHIANSLAQRSRVRIHHGTREVLGRVNLLDREELLPGESCFCQLVLESPLMALREDHFVIRSYSPMLTIGGGMIIDPAPLRHKRYRESVLKNLELKSLGDPQELVIQAMVESHSGLLSVKDIIQKSGLEEGLIQEQLAQLTKEQKTIKLSGEGNTYYILKSQESKWLAQVEKRLKDYHQKYPLRLGISKEELRSRDLAQLNGKSFNLLLSFWMDKDLIRIYQQSVALGEFKPRLTPELERTRQLIEEKMLKEPFAPPGWDEVAEYAGLKGDVKNEFFLWLLNNELLVKISDDVVMHQRAIAEAKEIIGDYIKAEDGVQLAATRDLLKTSRKYALPLLEYLDQVKFTRRQGDVRVLF